MRLEVMKSTDDLVQLELIPTDSGVYVAANHKGGLTNLLAISPDGVRFRVGIPASIGFPLDSKGRIKLVGYEPEASGTDRTDSNLRLVAGNAFTKLEEIRGEAIASSTFGPNSNFANRLLAVINDLKAALVP